MKEIKAYIHKHRVADVIQALKASGHLDAEGSCGCRNLFVHTGHGVLRSSDQQEQRYSLDLAESVIDEYKLELVCDDDHLDQVVAVIRQAAHAWGNNAGWILVSEVASAIPIP